MTVASTQNRIQYTANGTLAQFSFPFRIFGEADIVVYFDETEKNQGGDYTVIPASGGWNAGGYILCSDIPADGAVVTIVRECEIIQETDLQEFGRLPAESIEAALDRAIIICQQVAASVGRGITLPLLEQNNMILPAASERAGKFLAFDDVGAIGVRRFQPVNFELIESEKILTSSDAMYQVLSTWEEMNKVILPPPFAGGMFNICCNEQSPKKIQICQPNQPFVEGVRFERKPDDPNEVDELFLGDYPVVEAAGLLDGQKVYANSNNKVLRYYDPATNAWPNQYWALVNSINDPSTNFAYQEGGYVKFGAYYARNSYSGTLIATQMSMIELDKGQSILFISDGNDWFQFNSIT